MSRDPSERFQQVIEFNASEWYPGLVDLLIGRNPSEITSTAFSLPDLAVLRAKIDELLGIPVCPPCADGRHRDCPRHYADSEKHLCGCDNRSVHAEITIAQVTYLRLSRRRV